MLHVNKHRATLWGHRNPRYFAICHPSKETPNFLGIGIRYEQLVIQAVLLGTVGLDKETAIGVSPLPAAYVMAAGLVGVAIVIAGPQMILAWALRPSDFDFEGLEDEDG